MAEDAKRINFIIHPEKCTNNTFFLGGFWNKGELDLPLPKVLGKALYPERYRNYKDLANESHLN
jgi:hypothetical protein